MCLQHLDKIVTFSLTCPKISYHTGPRKHALEEVQSLSKMTNTPADADTFYGPRAGLSNLYLQRATR